MTESPEEIAKLMASDNADEPDPDIWFRDYIENPDNPRLPEDVEMNLMTKPALAVLYASHLKRRWPEAEPYILNSDSWQIHRYASEVIHGRWLEAEPLIIKAAIDNSYKIDWVYCYARDVIKGRWPEAERLIMRDPASANEYAYNILHARWPEAEPFIIEDSASAVEYATFVLKRRWPEAEPTIILHNHPRREYMHHFGISILGAGCEL